VLGPATRALVEERCGEKEAIKLRRAPTLVLATAVLSGDERTDAEDLHATACAVYAVLLGATERGDAYSSDCDLSVERDGTKQNECKRDGAYRAT